MKNKVQLITYPDSLGGDLINLRAVLETDLSGVFQGGVHILPPFPSSGDRGFAPLTYGEIEPAFGSWDDIRAIAKSHDVMVDVMVNHISRSSAYFQDFVKLGRASEYADMFITLDKVWADGNPKAEDVAKIFLRKPEHPFSNIKIESTGEIERIWTSFGPRADWSEQMDLDVHSAVTKQLFSQWFQNFAEQGVSVVRLDAVAYVNKKAGTDCFFIEPDLYEFLDEMTELASGFGINLLPEVHAHYKYNQKLSEHGYWIYDFILPMLVLFSLTEKTTTKLQTYLKTAPKKQFTTLDTHDGIPVQPDMNDILDVDESVKVVDKMLKRGANLNRILGDNKLREDFDAHQINITYWDAVGRDADLYLMARAIQFFTPGIPQVYYVGALAGENDLEAVVEQEEGRAVNRHNYTREEIRAALEKPVVQRLLTLIELRNTHPAFEGEFAVEQTDDKRLSLRWQNGDHVAHLRADLSAGYTAITLSDGVVTKVIEP